MNWETTKIKSLQSWKVICDVTWSSGYLMIRYNGTENLYNRYVYSRLTIFLETEFISLQNVWVL